MNRFALFLPVVVFALFSWHWLSVWGLLLVFFQLGYLIYASTGYLFFSEEDLFEGVEFRVACLNDLDDLITLEQRVWGEGAANRAQLLSRIEHFPEGSIIAIDQGVLVAYVSAIIIAENNTYRTWNDYTDNGFGVATYDKKGKLLFGINLSSDKAGGALGFKMLESMMCLVVRKNLKLGQLGVRIPYYHKYPNVPAEEYVKLKRKNGRVVDPELRLFYRMGFKLKNVEPEYFPDPESLNYGAIIYWKNPFYWLTRHMPWLAPRLVGLVPWYQRMMIKLH